MIQPKLKNEHGMTLVELLAALALFSIVIVLGGSLISSMSSSEKSVSGDISLQQKTNVLMSEMREAYYSGTGVGDLYVDLEALGLSVQGTEIKNDGKFLNIKNNYIEGVNFEKPLSVKLTTSAGPQEVTVESTWKQTDKKEISLQKSRKAQPPKLEDYEWGKEIDELPCDSDGNVKWSGKKYEKNCKPKKKHHNINGALWITNDMKEPDVNNKKHYDIKIEKDLFSDEEFETEEHWSILVGKSAIFHEEVDLEDHSRLEIIENAFFIGKEGEDNDDAEVELEKKAKLIIRKSAFFHGDVEVGEDDNAGAEIKIEGNGTFNKDLVLDKNSEVFITQNGFFYGALEIENNASINIFQDAKFKKTDDYDIAGTICVEGEVSPSNFIYEVSKKCKNK
ncbi:hypothetical protein JNUCC1_00637 [Lentibacillus sp. JNUCC-1]|uniref:prepilin-type N-terminal cleavage/methylation domain-containing protein n=1 Tax=Lentibacillus sp. JNUCC-1 TaxID=2654513 RepID=UPI0012E925A7|nr:prepilin-type N-terminal cleavage/methylation domain-containing protein [Lentibacillus sp. JNUCC-1]MUV36833.1 hypothetical protein [Lentibacillus sp. JNUCC-1]